MAIGTSLKDESGNEFSDFDIDQSDERETDDEISDIYEIRRKAQKEKAEDFIERSFNELVECEKELTSAREENNEKRNKIILFILCALGILIFYLLFGILQEDITKDGYGQGYPEGPDYWKYMITLVWITTTMNSIISKIILACLEKRCSCIQSNKLYLFCGLFNSVSLVFTNKSLQYVSYPVQVLGKACRPIPVIIFSALIAKKFHSIQKWIAVILITVGISVFIYDEDKHIKENEMKLNLTETSVNGTVVSTEVGGTILHEDLREDQQFFWVEMGDIMLFASLIFDGLTGAMQEKIRSQNQEQKQRKIVMPLVMMSTLNSYASIVTLIMSVSSSETIPAFNFLANHPRIIGRIALLSLCSSFGQICIFICVIYFGALTASIVTTLRKFFTLLCSVLVFGDKIDTKQGIGAVIVFLGIIIDMTSKKSNKKVSKVEPVLELEDLSPKDEGRGLLEDYDRMNEDYEDYDHEIFNINHKKSYI